MKFIDNALTKHLDFSLPGALLKILRGNKELKTKRLLLRKKERPCYKKLNLIFNTKTKIITATGYQVIQKLQATSEIPPRK